MGIATLITSSQNSKIKLVRALLGRAKERREANAFVVEGVRLVDELVKAQIGIYHIKFALYDETVSQRGRSIVETLKSQNIEVDEIPSSLMKMISEIETPQGILAVVELFHLPIPTTPNFVLIFDQIRDPGNLGTLLRTAWATGVQSVLLTPDSTDTFSPKVVRSGMGAQFHVPIYSPTWEEIRAYTEGLQLYLADMEGQSCWETDLRKPLALIIGGEAEGASEQARKLTTHKISIPMSGDIESLNAGVAGSVLMFEVVRQRKSVG
jgi:RNA methyltransferase, TrmH family